MLTKTHLVLQTVEGSVTERALVWTRDLALVHVESGICQRLDGGIIGVQTTGDGVGNRSGEGR
jgi:hypothetical protein